MEYMIETRNLTKLFGKVTAVRDVSLKVRQGEIYGFLGLNGAGKTTTIRMLLGMIHPASGAAYLCGEEVQPGKTGIWKNVGYLVESPSAYPELSVRENLELVCRLRGLTDRHAVDAVMAKLQLGPYAARKARHLSTGNAQRLGLAKALIHHPSLLILDEPANGLDPAGILEIRELLRDLAFRQGVTIFLSSHILAEVARFATRIGIIHQGCLLEEVDTERLDQLRHKRLLLDMADKEAAKAQLTRLGYAVDLATEGYLEIKTEQAIRQPEQIAIQLVQANLPPTLLKVEEEDLESYFLRTIGMKGGTI